MLGRGAPRGPFLLVQRGGPDGDWVLPGGRPRPRESMHACARRETYEETGLRVTPSRCAFVGEVMGPDEDHRVVELIFMASLDSSTGQEPRGESGTTPAWVHRSRLSVLALRPPIAGFLSTLGRHAVGTAPYLGNLWRPESARTATGETDWPPPR